MSPTKRPATPADDQADSSPAPAAGGETTTPDASAGPDAVSPVGSADLPADIAALSYEAARDQLVEVVRRLESGQGGLEDSIGLWERGELLATRCQQWLDGARTRLDEAVARRSQD